MADQLLCYADRWQLPLSADRTQRILPRAQFWQVFTMGICGVAASELSSGVIDDPTYKFEGFDDS
jgi:hypothetical protein